MYQIVYQWFAENIFTDNSITASWTIGGQTIAFNEWLSHTGTIAVLIALCVACGMAIVWLFKLFFGAVRGFGK